MLHVHNYYKHSYLARTSTKTVLAIIYPLSVLPKNVFDIFLANKYMWTGDRYAGMQIDRDNYSDTQKDTDRQIDNDRDYMVRQIDRYGRRGYDNKSLKIDTHGL